MITPAEWGTKSWWNTTDWDDSYVGRWAGNTGQTYRCEPGHYHHWAYHLPRISCCFENNDVVVSLVTDTAHNNSALSHREQCGNGVWASQCVPPKWHALPRHSFGSPCPKVLEVTALLNVQFWLLHFDSGIYYFDDAAQSLPLINYPSDKTGTLEMDQNSLNSDIRLNWSYIC